MNKFWIAATVTCLLAIGAVAQTSASGSASGNASVTPGQASAGANTSQSVQTPGAAANTDASANANAKTSHDQESSKKEKGSGSKDSGAKSSASGSGSGAAMAGVEGTHGVLSSGATLQAELSKSVDAKKAKSGDEVTARLTQDVKTDGKVVLHKGSKLVGHITEAQEKNKENAESRLGMVFDKAVLKGGEEVAFNGVIQALAPPAQGALSVAGDESSSLGSGVGSGSGSAMGGGRSSRGLASVGAATGAAGSVVGGAAGSVTNSAGATRGAVGAVTNGTVNAASHGVMGMQGVALNTAAAGSAQGSVISSPNRTIKLDSGTQMILQVAGSAAAH